MNIWDLMGPPPEPEASRYRRTAETTWSAWRNGRVRHHYSQSPDAVLDAIERRRQDPIAVLRDMLNRPAL